MIATPPVLMAFDVLHVHGLDVRGLPLPLDNNRTERGLRGVVLGRKNHYGSRSHRGLDVAALFYSLIESAKVCGVEPKAYLRHAMRAALADRAAVTLPHTLLT